MTLEEKTARLMKGTAALYAPSPEIVERLMDTIVKQRYDIGQTDECERDTAWNNGNFCVHLMRDVKQRTSEIRLSTIDFCHGLGLEVIEITEVDFYDIPVRVMITTAGHETKSIVARVKRWGTSYVIDEVAPPKFSVGDWYVTRTGVLGQIVGFHDGRYGYKCYTKVTVRNCEYEVFDSNCTKVVWDK